MLLLLFIISLGLSKDNLTSALEAKWKIAQGLIFLINFSLINNYLDHI